MGISEPVDYNSGAVISLQNVLNSSRIKIEKNKIGNWWITPPYPIGPGFFPFTKIKFAFKPSFAMQANYNSILGFQRNRAGADGNNVTATICPTSYFSPSISQEIPDIGTSNYIQINNSI